MATDTFSASSAKLRIEAELERTPNKVSLLLSPLEAVLTLSDCLVHCS